MPVQHQLSHGENVDGPVKSFDTNGFRPAHRTKMMAQNLFKRSEKLYGYAISPDEHRAIVAKEQEMFERFHHDDVAPLAKPLTRKEPPHE